MIGYIWSHAPPWYSSNSHLIYCVYVLMHLNKNLSGLICMANLGDVDFSHSFAQIIYKPIYKILICLCKPLMMRIGKPKCGMIQDRKMETNWELVDYENPIK